MRLDRDGCRSRVAAASVARLATAGSDHHPHLVPITFAVRADIVITAVDQKPKSTTRLRRLRNIAENPRVSVLCDHYEPDWTQLWWVRADGSAAILTTGPERESAVEELVRKYPQYRTEPPTGPVIMIAVDRWTGWIAGGP